MKLIGARSSRLRRLVLTSVALLLATAGIASLSPIPAQAGWAGENGRLVAAIYNDTVFPLEYVGGWSEFGFSQTPTYVPQDNGDVNGRAQFGVQGSPVALTNFCYWAENRYNAWFTYKVTVPYSGGVTEFITISIYGTRKYSRNGSCTTDVHPGIYVYQTSTPPPSTWRHTAGPPPNLIAQPKFSYVHNVPFLYDQTIQWNHEGPGVGVPAIVSLGDSTISGEGGRWAGNTNVPSSQRVDAGATSYWDIPTGESIDDCHRSKSALVHIGDGFRTANFACSAAMTYSYPWEYPWPQGWRWKPGVDVSCNGQNGVGYLNCHGGLKTGQLNELHHYARTHNVKHVVLAVGANDFDFSGVLKECVKLYEIEHFAAAGNHCFDTLPFWAAITDANRQRVEDEIYQSIKDLAWVMERAGYSSSMYTLILQNYWSAIPDDMDIRIPDHEYDRQNMGGCPFLYGDPTVLNQVLLKKINDSVLNVAKRVRSQPGLPQIRFMDVSGALKGHRLCEKGVGLIEDIPGFTGNGTSPQAADKLEWVTQARTVTTWSNYTLAEGGHANYWGQLAQRNCLREMIREKVLGGKCYPALHGGVNWWGEPNMMLAPLQW